MSWVQVFPVGNAETADLERFIFQKTKINPTITQIEQASYDFRVGYALFETPEIARDVSRELNKLEFNKKIIRAIAKNPEEDEYGILVGPKGFVQEGNYDNDRGSRYYPGQQTVSPSAGSSKRHTNRRSYQQQQTDPRNFGSIANKYNDDVQPENQQNSRYPPSSFNNPQQYSDQGFDQRGLSMVNNESNQFEKAPSQSKESKSKSSRHRKHRKDSSDSSSSSSSSSDSSYSSPKQSRHKHRHHHHHHRKSK